MVFFFPDSTDWPRYIAKLPAQNRPNTDYDRLANSMDVNYVYAACLKIQSQPNGLSAIEIQNVYRILLPAIFIVLNPDFITFVNQHNNVDAYFLNGSRDKAQKFLRTNHGFAIRLANHVDMLAEVRSLNDYLKSQSNVDTLVNTLKNTDRGVWQDLLSKLPLNPRTTSTSVWSTRLLPTDSRACNFTQWQRRFYDYNLPDALLEASISDRPSFNDFFNKVTQKQQLIVERYNQKHAAIRDLDFSKYVRRTLTTLIFIEKNQAIIAKLLDRKPIPSHYFRNTVDRGNGVLRSNVEMSFHLHYDSGAQFKNFINGAIQQLDAVLSRPLDDTKFCELAMAFKPNHDEDKGCLDERINPILMKIVELDDTYINIHGAMSSWQQNTEGKVCKTLSEALPSAWQYCVSNNLAGKKINNTDVLTQAYLQNYLKTILCYVDPPVSTAQSVSQPVGPTPDAVTRIRLPSSARNSNSQATSGIRITFSSIDMNFGYYLSEVEQLLKSVCASLNNEINRLKMIKNSNIATAKLNLLTAYETNVFATFNYPTMTESNSKQLITILLSEWGKLEKTNQARSILHQDRDSHLTFLRVIGPLTAFILPLIAYVTGYLTSGFSSKKGQEYAAIFSPRGTGFFGSQTKSERNVLTAVEQLQNYNQVYNSN